MGLGGRRSQGRQVRRHSALRRYVGVRNSKDILSQISAGFGLSGIPETLLKALSKRTDLQDILAVSNNAGAGDKGLGKHPPTCESRQR